MKFIMDDGLPIVSAEIAYNDRRMRFDNLLIDTGCASTILDTDLVEEIGLLLDLENAITRRMYGIGGTEICIEQNVESLWISDLELEDFPIQLGDIRHMYGFDGIIGSDFFVKHQIMIDFKNMEIKKI